MKSQPAEQNKKASGEKEAVSATTRETQIARSVESLSDDELRLEVAKYCGWLPSSQDSTGLLWGYRNKGKRNSRTSEVIPFYSTSLDAAAEFEKTLSKDVLRYLAYAKLLTETLGAYDAILAAARPRAIAFVTVMEAQKDQDLGEKETKDQ